MRSCNEWTKVVCHKAISFPVPYNALEVVQGRSYTSFMYLGSVVAALP
jgi:hypothetical protein